MKRYIKEILILLLQLFTFYIIPLFSSSIGAIGMVLIILLMTFILSTILGIISKEKIKYIYPLIVAILFIPSIYIYYNKSALVHSLWYLIDSSIGILIGVILNKWRLL